MASSASEEAMALDYELMKAVGALLGPFVGFAGGLAVAWVVDRAKVREAEEKRLEALNAWFEKFTVTDGVEPVIEYLISLEQHFKQANPAFFGKEVALPLGPLHHLTFVLGHNHTDSLLFAIYNGYKGEAWHGNAVAHEVREELYGKLWMLQIQLHKIKISEKADLWEVKDKPKIRGISNEIKELREKMDDALRPSEFT